LNTSGLGQVFGAFLLISGTAICVLGVYGMVRLPDIYNRIHSAGKVMTFGAGGALISLLFLATPRAGFKGLATAIFLLLTAPVVSHLLAGTAYRLGVSLGPEIERDDLADDRRRNETRPARPES
jgi:multicomponent Na+:H+ antiporter subunit G